MKGIAMFPGTFDPITLGHEDLIARAAKLYDSVWVAVAASARKLPLLTLDERVALTQQVVSSHGNVQVCAFDGLLVDCAKAKGAQVIVRSARNTTDFNHEFQMAATNAQLNEAMETVLMLPRLRLMGVCATFVREIWQMGGDIRSFVSPQVLAFLNER